MNWRWSFLVACLFIFTAGGSRQTINAAQGGQSQYGTVVTQYCSGCHNDRLKSGDLALTAFDIDKAAEHPEVWEKVVRKLRGRMMPPLGRPRPDEKTYDTVVSYLEKSLDNASAAKPNPGRTETF